MSPENTKAKVECVYFWFISRKSQSWKIITTKLYGSKMGLEPQKSKFRFDLEWTGNASDFRHLKLRWTYNGSIFPSNYITHITLMVNGNHGTSMNQHILCEKWGLNHLKNSKVRLEPLKRTYENVHPSNHTNHPLENGNHQSTKFESKNT